MKHKFLILPNTLFDIKYLDKSYNYIIYEHPEFFTKYKFNKKKLILHRASMRYYYDLLKDNKYNVKYINFYKEFDTNATYTYFDPINKIKINGIKLESPNFILSQNIYNEYNEKTNNYKFNNFYKWSRNRINLYPELKSTDTQNRKIFKNDIVIPKKNYITEDDLLYIKKAKIYVNNYFKNNYGNIDNFIFPITHNSSKNMLIDFLKNKLIHFGDYQDYINKDDNFMFHSLLSSILNIGLLNPNDIINQLSKYKNKVDINNFEGFLRQLFWREYQRYCYVYIDFSKLKYFNNGKYNLDDSWYKGTTGILPLDNIIKSGIDTGYIHHIGRLMIVGNYMMLSNINPNSGFKWFMEFSTDSYEWVMFQNVYEMVFCVSGGLTMRRPYISSSNYILKMSNYKKDTWCKTWDDKFIKFIKTNIDKMYKFRYFYPIVSKYKK